MSGIQLPRLRRYTGRHSRLSLARIRTTSSVSHHAERSIAMRSHDSAALHRKSVIGPWAAFGAMFVVFFTLGRSHAADWPQWRGPNRDGISKETGLVKEWPKEGPKLLWQATDLGDGYSTPAIVGGR